MLAVCAAMSIPDLTLKTQNPITPIGVYIADPSARVAPDERMYS